MKYHSAVGLILKITLYLPDSEDECSAFGFLRGRPLFLSDLGLVIGPGALVKKHNYLAIMFLLYVGEKGCVAQIVFPTCAYEFSIFKVIDVLAH